MWLDKIILLFKIPDLRKKILFVLGLLVVFRIMANIPIPGVDAAALQRFFGEFEILGLVSIFTGGALETLSVAMLGLGPYITAVIILQLLTMIFPQLKKIYQEEGEAGRQKFNQWGRIATVPLAMLQGFGMLTLLQRQGIIGEFSPILMLSSLLTITAGTLILMWFGELITEKGIGNGVSILIFAGIIAMVPGQVRAMIVGWDPAMIFTYLAFFLVAFFVIISVVLINEGKRNIPISYAKRVRGMKMYGGSSTYLPLNVNPAGVIPIIFALSLLTLPVMLSQFFLGAGGIMGSIAVWVSTVFEPGRFMFIFFQFFLVFVFTFFYTIVTFDPKSISTNLQKMGGFVPGIRPGNSTTNYLKYVLYRTLPIGAIFLGLIAIMPPVVAIITRVEVFGFLVGGAALLIIVSVVLETMRQIKAQLQMREYETF